MNVVLLLLQVLCEARSALLKVDTRNLSTVAKILAAAAARLSPKGNKGSPTPATLIAAHCCHSSRTSAAPLSFCSVVFEQNPSLQ